MKSLKTKLREFLGLKTVKQLTRFLITGSISTIISFCVFSACVRIFGLHYLLANLMAFLLSISFSYNFNKRWSFSGPHHKQSHVFEYLLVYFSSLLLSSAILKITVGMMGLIPEIAFFISLCFTTCFNFTGIKFFVFKK